MVFCINRYTKNVKSRLIFLPKPDDIMLFGQAEPSDQFGRGQHEDHFVNYFDFGPVVQEISFEDISYLEHC